MKDIDVLALYKSVSRMDLGMARLGNAADIKTANQPMNPRIL